DSVLPLARLRLQHTKSMRQRPPREPCSSPPLSPPDVFFDHPIGFVGMSIKLTAKTQVRDDCTNCHHPRKRMIQYAAAPRFYLKRWRLLDAHFRWHDGIHQAPTPSLFPA